MRNTAVVKLDGEFVLATAYGADPSCLGLDLYRGSENLVTAISSSRLWGIEYVRGGMAGFLYGDNFSDNPHCVRVVDVDNPGKEVRKMCFDTLLKHLTKKEEMIVILRYVENIDFAIISRVMDVPQEEVEQTYIGVAERLRGVVDLEKKERFYMGFADVEYDVMSYGDIFVRTGTSPDSIEQRTINEILPESGELNPEQENKRKLELMNRYNDILDALEKSLPEQRVLSVLRRKLNSGSDDVLSSHVEWDPGELGSEYLELVTDSHRKKIEKIKAHPRKLKSSAKLIVDHMIGSEQSDIDSFVRAFSERTDDFETLSLLGLDDEFSILLLETNDPFRYAPIEVLKRKYLK